MYQFLAFVSGLVLAFAVTFNSGLTQAMGPYPAALAIHVIGAAFALLFMQFQKNRVSLWRQPLWMYTGGMVGVITLLSNTLSFPHISITSLMALGLMGQAILSLAVDKWGLMGMEKRPFTKSTLIGLAICALGMGMMLDGSIGQANTAVLLSLFAGFTIVISRSINARLAAHIGALGGSFINHLAGIPVCLVLVLLLGGTAKSWPAVMAQPWNLLGGLLGVAIILLANITVPRVAALRLTVLTFVGQLLAGLLIDLALGKVQLNASFYGGLVIALGIAVNLVLDYVGERKNQRKAKA